ncbi:hypothetical protein NIES2104_65730 [Leptolyngbya sp. NIES-2104]|nr:hypothetical protein NIES2104_65730 [Leptolyngbya sp. NIES-2104]
MSYVGANLINRKWLSCRMNPAYQLNQIRPLQLIQTYVLIISNVRLNEFNK